MIDAFGEPIETGDLVALAHNFATTTTRMVKCRVVGPSKGKLGDKGFIRLKPFQYPDDIHKVFRNFNETDRTHEKIVKLTTL